MRPLLLLLLLTPTASALDFGPFAPKKPRAVPADCSCPENCRCPGSKAGPCDCGTQRKGMACPDNDGGPCACGCRAKKATACRCGESARKNTGTRYRLERIEQGGRIVWVVVGDSSGRGDYASKDAAQAEADRRNGGRIDPAPPSPLTARERADARAVAGYVRPYVSRLSAPRPAAPAYYRPNVGPVPVWMSRPAPAPRGKAECVT